jgi:hypothetical protein
MVDPRTPVLIGVGQFTERIDDADYRGMSAVDLATEAARAALADTGVATAKVAAAVDADVVMIMGSEPGSTARYFANRDDKPDFTEHVNGQLEDRTRRAGSGQPGRSGGDDVGRGGSSARRTGGQMGVRARPRRHDRAGDAGPC